GAARAGRPAAPAGGRARGDPAEALRGFERTRGRRATGRGREHDLGPLPARARGLRRAAQGTRAVTRVARERTSGPENEAQRRALAFLQLEGSALGAAAFPGPGDRVADFVIEHELGRGGAGVVYRARQLHLGRSVALKLIPHGPATLTDEYARRLEREG